MTPHEPVIADGGRRCDFPISPGQRCNLLAEEHPQTVYVAYLDTGGISYSAAEYAAVASTAAEAEAAVYAAWDASPARGDHPGIKSAAALVEWYGIKVWPLTLDGAAARVD